MKKFITIMLLMAFAIVASAQSVTRTLPTIQKGSTYLEYTAVAGDTLSTYQDSIIFVVRYENDWTTKWQVGATFQKRSGNDTLVTIRLSGKYFADESYPSSLAIGTTANVTTTSIQKTVAYATANGYRYMRISLQLLGMKSTGVKLKKLEIKLIQQ